MSNEIKSNVANASPLGLLGFGMTTVLLNLHNAGIIQLSVVIAAMGFALGGLAQIIAGIFEMKKGNTFGGTAFTAYGCFWWSLVFIWTTPGGLVAADKTSMGFYLLLWCLFTLFMFVGALKHNTITQLVFGSLTILFFALSLGDFLNNHLVIVVAGIIGIVCGLFAIYSAVGQIVNNEYGKTILPL